MILYFWQWLTESRAAYIFAYALVRRSFARLQESCKLIIPYLVSRCNGSRESIKQLISDLNAAPPTADVDIICAPPFVYLDQVLRRTPGVPTPALPSAPAMRPLTPRTRSQVVSTLGPRYKVSAQNSWIAGLGAYTGEIADEMILDIGARYGQPRTCAIILTETRSAQSAEPGARAGGGCGCRVQTRSSAAAPVG